MADPMVPTENPDARPPDARMMGCRVAAWFELCEFGEWFWLAGIRRRIGPQGDLRAAVREKLEAEMKDRDERLRHLLMELGRREKAGGH